MGQQLPTKNYGKEQELRTACGPVNPQKFVHLRNCAQKPFKNCLALVPSPVLLDPKPNPK